MVHRGKRSLERLKEREQKRRRRDIEHTLLLQYSQFDPLNGEICHTVHTEPIVYEKIRETCGDNNSLVCERLEYGQVLNRFSFWDIGGQVPNLAK